MGYVYIDKSELMSKVFESQHDNPHTNVIARRTHHLEHDHFLKLILDAPTYCTVAERTIGRWRLETDEEQPEFTFKLSVCSACGGKANDTYKFCPNCGATMIFKKREIHDDFKNI